MAAAHILTHALLFGAAANLYLFLIMILFSPRVWGYADYQEVIKKKVPAQTGKEKALAAAVSLPWFVIIPGSDKADYKDFSHHYRGHLRAVPPLAVLCLLIAGIVCLF